MVSAESDGLSCPEAQASANLVEDSVQGNPAIEKMPVWALFHIQPSPELQVQDYRPSRDHPDH